MIAAVLALRPDSGGDPEDAAEAESTGDADSFFADAAITFVDAWGEGDYDAMLEIADEDVADTFIEMPFPDPAPELDECSEQVGGETLCNFPVELDTLVFELHSEEIPGRLFPQPRVVAGYLDDSQSLYYLITGPFLEAWQDGDDDRLYDLALPEVAEQFAANAHPEFADFTYDECVDAVDLSSECHFDGPEGHTLVLSTAILEDRGFVIVFGGAYDGDGNEILLSDLPQD